MRNTYGSDTTDITRTARRTNSESEVPIHNRRDHSTNLPVSGQDEFVCLLKNFLMRKHMTETTTLLDILQELHYLGYTEHIYRTSQGVLCYQSLPLDDATIKLHKITYDENDLRITVSKVDSVCGLIKGALVE